MNTDALVKKNPQPTNKQKKRKKKDVLQARRNDLGSGDVGCGGR